MKSLEQTSTSNSVDIAHIYIQRAEGLYSTVVTDLGLQFDSFLFRTDLGRLRSECQVVPRQAYWPHLAGKEISVLRT